MCCSVNGSIRWRSRAWSHVPPLYSWSIGACGFDETPKQKPPGFHPEAVAERPEIQRFDFFAFFFLVFAATFFPAFLVAFFAAFLLFLADFFAVFFAAFAFLGATFFFLGAAFFATFFVAFLTF